MRFLIARRNVRIPTRRLSKAGSAVMNTGKSEGDCGTGAEKEQGLEDDRRQSANHASSPLPPGVQ